MKEEDFYFYSPQNLGKIASLAYVGAPGLYEGSVLSDF